MNNIETIFRIIEICTLIMSVIIAYLVFKYNKSSKERDNRYLSVVQCKEFLYNVLIPMEREFTFEKRKAIIRDLMFKKNDTKKGDIKNFYEYREYIIKIDAFCLCVKTDTNPQGIYDKEIFNLVCKSSIMRLMAGIAEFSILNQYNSENEESIIGNIDKILFKDLYKELFNESIKEFFNQEKKYAQNVTSTFKEFVENNDLNDVIKQLNSKWGIEQSFIDSLFN